jgi:hypothetical protein
MEISYEGQLAGILSSNKAFYGSTDACIIKSFCHPCF